MSHSTRQTVVVWASTEHQVCLSPPVLGPQKPLSSLSHKSQVAEGCLTSRVHNWKGTFSETEELWSPGVRKTNLPLAACQKEKFVHPSLSKHYLHHQYFFILGIRAPPSIRMRTWRCLAWVKVAVGNLGNQREARGVQVALGTETTKERKSVVRIKSPGRKLSRNIKNEDLKGNWEDAPPMTQRHRDGTGLLSLWS